MRQAHLSRVDRAMILLGTWGVAYLAFDAFMKLWVQDHVAEYSDAVQTWPVRVVAVIVAGLFILTCPIGLAMAVRGLRRWTVRIAVTLAAFGYLSILASWVPGLLENTPRIVGPLHWATPAALAGVVLLAVVWWAQHACASPTPGPNRRERVEPR